MALKPLNSVGGFSVGEIPANVILANADITANNATFQGNVAISNATASWGVLTDNLYYSNGQPWDFQQAAGSNGEIQFNMGDDFSASANLTFDDANSLFKVIGNANITGTLTVGALEVDEIFNGNSNVAIPVANGNVNISVAGNANVLVVTGTGANVAGYLDVSGGIEGANLSLNDGNIVSLGTSGLYLTPANATAGIVLQANTAPNANNSFNLGSTSKVWANIYGNNVIVSANLDSGNANLGNLAVANYVNVNNDLNVTAGIYTGNIQVNVSANFSNVQVANFVVSNLTPSTDDQYYLGTSLKRWKELNIAGNANIATLNVSGNGTFGNLEFGNLLTGNYATFDNDIQVLGNIANANNVSVTNTLAANTGNFSGNITSLNANLGNLVNANYANFAQNVNVNGTLNTFGIEANGNISISNSNPAYGIKTDNLYYSNGQPWDLQQAAGSNTQVQFNNNNDFGASANFTFNTATDTLTVTGNANVTNTVNTPNIDSGAGNLTLTANGFSTVFDDTGNVTFPADIIANTFYGNVNANISITAANTSVLYSDNGLVSGASGFTFDKVSNLFSTPGNLDVADAINVTNASYINSVYISQTQILGDGNGIQLQDNTNGAQINWNNNSYVWVDNTGVNFEVANSIVANMTTSGNWNLPNNLSVVGNIANVNNISVTNNVNAVTGNFSGNVTANNFTTSGSGGNITGANVVSANTFSGNLLASYANITGNTITNNLSVNLELAGNTANFTGNVILSGPNVTVNNQLDGNTATFSGNVEVNNLDVNLELSGNTANFSGNVQVNNLDVNLELSGNTANFSGNVILPNLTVNSELAGNTANFIGNVTLSGPNVVVNNHLGGNTATFSGNVEVNNFDVNLELSGNTANFTGNVVLSGANVTVNNHLGGNTATFSGNVEVNNLDVNLELSGNTANFIGNVVLSGPNVIVNNNIDGNTANFSGNISALNANLGNIVDANYIRTQELYNGTSNIRIAPNGNVTFSSNATGNVVTISDVGVNVVGYVSANGNGTFGALYSNSLTAQGGNLSLYSEQAGNTYVQIRAFGDGTVDVGNTRITSLATPNASTDAATKQYVDDVAQGLNVHDAAYCATANTLAILTGGTITYNNGTGGVGANLVLSGSPTANYLSANVFDGNTQAVVGSRILVKSEANAATNGVYVVDSATVLTRASDYNTVPEVEAGDFIFVQDGDTYNDSGWVQTSVVTTIGTDPINFTQFSGAGTYQAGAGLTLTGTVFSVNVDNLTTEISGGNVIVKANAQLTTPNIGAATGTSVDLTGNVLANNLNANTKVTTVDLEATGNIIAANISANANLLVNNATVNLELSGNTANFSGNVIVPNLTVNTTLSGNIANFTGNLTSLNANLGNLATANYINVANLITTVDANVTGTLTVANANFAGNLTVNNLTVNLELAGNTANFTGNVILPNLQVNTTLAGNVGNFTGNIQAANLTSNNYVIAGNANVSGNTITNNLTVNVELSGNTANFSSNVVVHNLTTNLELAGNTANFTGNVILPNLTVNLELQANTANFDGNVVMDNWLTVSNTANVGNLRTDNLLYANGQPWDFMLPAGSNTQVQYNDGAGSFGASANFTFDVATSTLAVTGNANVSQVLNGNVGNFSGNMTVNNLLSNGLANVGNLSIVSNVQSNVLPSANVTFDLGAGSQRWANVYAGNIDASGSGNFAGNISANNFTSNTIVADVKANIGPTQIIYGNVTTSSTSANQTIATVSTTGVTGVEWLVKGYDSTGAKYSMAIVTAVSDGANADYSTFGTVNLGGTTGSLAVNMVGSNIELQVTPSSSNSTVWITQFRTI